MPAKPSSGEAMLAGLKPYPKMKDSGVDWLGDMPTHWQGVTLRRYCQVFAGATPSRATPQYWDGGTIPWLASGDVNLRRILGAKQFITEAGHAASSTKWIRPGSLILALAGQGRTKGLVATVECRTTCNQSLAAIEPSPLISDHNFLAYYLESRYLDIRSLVGDGLRDGLNLEHVRAIPTPLPPLSEQTAIARFLDHATSRIERYIGAKEKLIALLEEQKQVIVHEAVTGRTDVRTGLPYPDYKPSGVEWLGDIPAHWEVRRLKWVTHLQRGYDLPSDNRLPGSVPVVSSGGIIDTHIEPRCGGPGVVLGRYGSTDAVFYIDEDFWPHNTSLFVTDFRGNHRKWCFYLLQTIAKGEYAGRSAVPGIDRKDLFQVAVPLPPAKVQQEISDHIDSVVHQLSIAISQERDQIDLLREYRTRLIADVVTGKLDVREAASAHT